MLTNMVQRHGEYYPPVDVETGRFPSQLAEKMVAYRRSLESGDKTSIVVDRMFLEVELGNYGLTMSDVARFFTSDVEHQLKRNEVAGQRALDAIMKI